MVIKGSALLALLAAVGTVSAYPTGDKVNELWQWTDISWGLYSGYAPIPSSKKSLHYVAALSQQNKTTDPVIVWFNGGPGCSSMLGFLQEHGPYSLEDGSTTFTPNPYSWNKEANVIYIEAPAGVGFSICGDSNECKWNDFNSADDNLQAFLAIMNKFPEL
jgi:carboxypeptidase C (cathepsin A)